MERGEPIVRGAADGGRFLSCSGENFTAPQKKTKTEESSVDKPANRSAKTIQSEKMNAANLFCTANLLKQWQRRDVRRIIQIRRLAEPVSRDHEIAGLVVT